MDTVLYEPALGYYARASRRSGSAGDFVTSVDYGPLFGRLLGRQVADMTTYLSRATPLSLVEAGAGDGRLSRAMLDEVAAVAPDVASVLHPHLVERSDAARQAQPATLGPWAARTVCTPTLPEAFSGILVANELLDALPAHRVVMRGRTLHEILVDVDGDQLVTRETESISPGLLAHLDACSAQLDAGQFADVSLDASAWMHEAASRLTTGFMLVIDYGAEASRLYGPSYPAGTLTSYRAHVASTSDADAWLQQPGDQDLTTHVDFTSVRRAAEAAGCVSLGLMDQTYFLMALATPLLTELDAAERRAFAALVMPGGLGSTMKVLVLAKGVNGPGLLGCSGPMRLT